MPSTHLTTLSAAAIARLVRARELSPVEVTEHFIARVMVHNPSLNAFITVAFEQAMDAAAAAERAVMRGDDLGPLHGVPIGIKDLNNTKGMRTTHGFALNRERVPSHDDIPVERIRRAGAVIVGKTNTPEFGWKGTTENGLGDACRNPWDTRRTSGGSSGGSASAVAARIVPIANGSDAGGSIRIPAGFCGVYGFKPTFGRVPGAYEGPGAWRSLSQNGPIANSVEDAALLLRALAGPDPRDATAIVAPPPDFLAAARTPNVHGLRLAWSPTLGGAPVHPAVREITAAAAKRFEALGATVEEAAPPVDLGRLIDVFMTLMLTDLVIGLEPVHRGGNDKHLPDLLRQWLDEARGWPAVRFAMALRDLEWHRYRWSRFFERHDLLLTPTMAVPAFYVDRFPGRIDDVDVDPRWGFTPFCIHANLTGQPAASVPCGFTADRLPVGLQIVGRHGDDATVLRASAAFEQAQPWAHRLPPRYAN
ncbi:MAG: amidase [SAR202 cluster bacterium]|nr:amidase [SAR202 cluster bacterium]